MTDKLLSSEMLATAINGHGSRRLLRLGMLGNTSRSMQLLRCSSPSNPLSPANSSKCGTRSMVRSSIGSNNGASPA